MKMPLEKVRLEAKPEIPLQLKHLAELVLRVDPATKALSHDVAPLFPHTKESGSLKFVKGHSERRELLKVGVLFSGGPASGGHNVIWGLFDGLKVLSQSFALYGFLNGPSGLIDGQFIEITEALLAGYKNMGGFDLLGSGRTKIATQEQFDGALKHVLELSLDGLVIIGGDDSNTNAALLAEYFLSKGCKTVVNGVPKTIDGDLKNEAIELSFGFDTATKVYSELISNIARDALSSRKYTHFIKLMGRSASHITLECALQTHPNCALIGEEKKTLSEIVGEITDMICERDKLKKNYGVILIPEGLVEFIPELLKDLSLFPEKIQKQLLLERDPHGNVQVSHIASEELIVYLVQEELKKRGFQGHFNPVHHFFGYEGRCALPTLFDANYCYSLGMISSLLIKERKSGYIATVSNLKSSTHEWHIGAHSLASMIHIEERKGKKVPVIAKALVDLQAPAYLSYARKRKSWRLDDEYCFVGPIQFFGPDAVTKQPPITL